MFHLVTPDVLGIEMKHETIEQKGKNRADMFRMKVEEIIKQQSISQIEENQTAAKEFITKNWKTWWDVELAAKAAKENDEKNEIYQQGLFLFKDNKFLINNYALFMKNILKNFNKAENIIYTP